MIKEGEPVDTYFLNKLEREVQEHKTRYFCFARIKVLLTILLAFGVGAIIYCWDDVQFYISANKEALVAIAAIIITVVSLGLLFFPLDYFYKKKKEKVEVF